jgi:signal transduction histidine kinase/PAS domain-containing protein
MTADPAPQDDGHASPDPPSVAPGRPSPRDAADISSGELARALFDESPLSTVVYDAAGRPLRVNPAFTKLWGASIGDVPAEYTVLDDPELDGLGVLPEVRRAFAGEAVVLPPVRYDMSHTLGLGRTTWTQGHFYPVRGADGAVTHVVLVHVDLTAAKEADEALRQGEDRFRAALRASGAVVFQQDLELRYTWLYDPALGRVDERVNGLTEAELGGDRVADALKRRVLDTGRPARGELRLPFVPGSRVFDVAVEPLRDAAGALAGVTCAGLDVTDRLREAGERERLLEQAEEARRAAEAARARASFLAEAGQALHSSLDHATTLAAVARLAVPMLADWCAVDVLEADGTIRRVAVAHQDPAKVALARQLQERYPVHADDATGVPAVLRTGRAERYDSIPDEMLAAGAVDEEHLRLLRSVGLRAALVLPLRGGERVLGALTLVNADSGRTFAPDDVELAEELARRSARALDNARLFREVTEAREALEQQAMELEIQSETLQEQATELEAQQAELEQQIEEVQVLNEDLHRTNDELHAASRAAEAARAAAEQAERDVRAILASIPDPFVITDAQWRWRYVNEPAAGIFSRAGHDPRGLVGRVMWDEYPDLVGTRYEVEMTRAVREGVPVTFEEFYPKAGTWAEIRCFPLPDGGLATAWRDVTARKRADEARHYLGEASAILASSLDYEATLKSLARLVVPRLADWCVVHVVDDDGSLRQIAVGHVDPAKAEWAAEMDRRYPPLPDAQTGIPQVVRTGRPELYPEVTDEMLQAGARDAEHLAVVRALGLASAIVVPLASGERVLGAMSLFAAQSGRRYGQPDLEMASELGRRAGTAVDNARLHADALRARAAAEEAAAEAVAANRAKAEFLAMMSHELRTPLNAIGGYAQIIEMGVHGPVTDAQAEDLARIQRSQHHLLSLINDVLNFAKIEAGRVQYHIERVPVHELLGNLEPLVAPQLAARELRYEYAGADPSLAVSADAEKVRQVLLNLLSNAIKFTGAGGTVSVSVRAKGETVEVQVRDSGAGIPADKLETVFEPFVQLSRGLTSNVEGTGLGLSISRDLARSMAGDLSVSSVPGEGSVFTLTLPRATN